MLRHNIRNGRGDSDRAMTNKHSLQNGISRLRHADADADQVSFLGNIL